MGLKKTEERKSHWVFESAVRKQVEQEFDSELVEFVFCGGSPKLLPPGDYAAFICKISRKCCT